MSNRSLNGENKGSPLINKISTQQNPMSPFRMINNNEKSPFTVEQTNCRLNEPLSPFSNESNSNKFARKPNDTNLKITTFQKASLNEQYAPISPFNVGSPHGSKTPQSLTSKGNQIFSPQLDMPIIPQADMFNQSNRSSWVTASSTINSTSPAFIDNKRELNMSNINSMVTNVRKGQESNIIDKILFDTQYSGLVDPKVSKELVRHNNKNNTLLKCFSRSSSGIFSFRTPDTAPNSNTVYCIDVGNEVGTTTIRVNKDKEAYKKIPENVYQNNKNPHSNNSSPMFDKKDTMLASNTKSPNNQSPRINTTNRNSSGQTPQNNNKITTTFSYDPEYLLWREAVMDILKKNNTEADNYGNSRINSYYKNINNENQIDYMLRMPIELLTLLNTKIK